MIVTQHHTNGYACIQCDNIGHETSHKLVVLGISIFVDGFGSFWVVLLVVVGGFGWFWVVLGSFGWFWVVLDGFGWFHVLVTTEYLLHHHHHHLIIINTPISFSEFPLFLGNVFPSLHIDFFMNNFILVTTTSREYTESMLGQDKSRPGVTSSYFNKGH